MEEKIIEIPLIFFWTLSCYLSLESAIEVKDHCQPSTTIDIADYFASLYTNKDLLNTDTVIKIIFKFTFEL
jgi:hypothetical protein